MELTNAPYIEIRFSYSPSYIYQECLGLARRITGFIPVENNSSGCNILLYTHEQVREYDVYFELLIEMLFRLKSTKVLYKGIEIERSLLSNLKWQHCKKKPQLYGKPIGIYEEFFKKE